MKDSGKEPTPTTTLNMDEFTQLCALWPELTLDLSDIASAQECCGLLRENMKAFIHSLEAPFDYHRKAVEDFNQWIRSGIPAYQDHPPIASLSELPIVSKAEFRRAAKDYRATESDPLGVWIKGTSGSTGPPRAIFYSTLFHHYATLLSVPRIAYRLRLKPDAGNLLYCFTIRDKPGEKPLLRFDPTGYSGWNLRTGVDTSLPGAIISCFEALAKAGAFCISSNPSLLAALVEIIPEATARAAGVKLIVSGGAALPESTKRRLEALFGARVCSVYGLSETGIVASECSLGSMHFNTADCYPEILPRSTEAPEGESCEIVLTATSNTEMPFLRYRTGDLGRLRSGACACGETSPVLESLDGRVVPAFYLPGGRIFSPTQFRNTFHIFPWLKEFQMIQEKETLIRVLFEASEEPVIPGGAENLRGHFLQKLGEGMEVQMQEHRFRPDDKFQRYKTVLQ
ncbi:MAG TPA: AMP-binding protein [Flavisolibacter sp.]